MLKCPKCGQQHKSFFKLTYEGNVKCLTCGYMIDVGEYFSYTYITQPDYFVDGMAYLFGLYLSSIENRDKQVVLALMHKLKMSNVLQVYTDFWYTLGTSVGEVEKTHASITMLSNIEPSILGYVRVFCKCHGLPEVVKYFMDYTTSLP